LRVKLKMFLIPLLLSLFLSFWEHRCGSKFKFILTHEIYIKVSARSKKVTTKMPSDAGGFGKSVATTQLVASAVASAPVKKSEDKRPVPPPAPILKRVLAKKISAALPEPDAEPEDAETEAAGAGAVNTAESGIPSSSVNQSEIVPTSFEISNRLHWKLHYAANELINERGSMPWRQRLQEVDRVPEAIPELQQLSKETHREVVDGIKYLKEACDIDPGRWDTYFGNVAANGSTRDPEYNMALKVVAYAAWEFEEDGHFGRIYDNEPNEDYLTITKFVRDFSYNCKEIQLTASHTEIQQDVGNG
jgi:hypothetical protein